MNHARKTLFLTALGMLASLMVGCGQANVRLGWLGTSSPGHMEASYARFTGTETRTVQAESGEALYLAYDAEVDSGGLTLEVNDPYGKTIWCQPLCEECGETKVLPVNCAGCYTISVRGEAAEGRFDLRWEQMIKEK